MSDDPNYMTPAGFKKIADEMEFLSRIERPKTVQEVSDAAAQGDRSENAEYIYGKKRLREIDRRLNFLASRLKNVQVVDPSKQSGDRVFFGATVETEDEEGVKRTWHIVGVDETDPAEGKISWRSPLGRALMKRREGDTVSVPRPERDPVEHTILAIRYE
ncbi:MAG: transcription elongation factor GreB [Polyangiales bacterium]